MIFKRIAVLSMVMFFVLGVCAIAEEPIQTEKQNDTTVSSASSKTSDATDVKMSPESDKDSKISESTIIDQKLSPEQETVKEESETVESSVVPTRVYSNRTYHGYTTQQIRSMPMVARPDRPGHFFGNTVRAIYRARRSW